MKKIITPYKAGELWDRYWGALSFDDNLKFCDGDQLLFFSTSI
jgi:hypothetical protein